MTPSRLPLSPLVRGRFLAALVASVAIHLTLPLFLSGGVSRRAGVANAQRVLSVRLMPAPRAPIVEALPEPAVANKGVPVTPSVPKTSPAPLRAAEPQTGTPHDAGALPELPDLTYYAARQLDVYPRPMGELDLKYSGKAADEGVTGRVRVLALIDELGRVTDVQVVEAEPPNYFEEAAKRTLLATRFSPAYRQGRAVRSRFQIELTYGSDSSR